MILEVDDFLDNAPPVTWAGACCFVTQVEAQPRASQNALP